MVIELAPSGGGGKAVYELTFGNASGEAKKPPPLEVSFEGLSGRKRLRRLTCFSCLSVNTILTFFPSIALGVHK